MDADAIALLVFALGLAAIAVIVIAPWRRVRAEKPLPAGVQARLLLGEDPQRVASDIDDPPSPAGRSITR